MNPTDPGTETNQNMNFFDYLKQNNLHYPTEVVENFLLSLKSKQFVILSGGSGTGKTKIAQCYGRFISKIPESYNTAEVEVTLNKLDVNKGATLDSNAFFSMLPSDPRKNVGFYTVKLGDVEAECEVVLQPRLWFRSSLNKFAPEIVKMRDGDKKEKGMMYIRIPQPTSSGDNYEIIPVGSNWTESRFITGYRNVLNGEYSRTKSLDLIIRSNEHPTEPHLLVLDEMNLSHVERYFSEILSAMESGEKIELDSDGKVPESITIDGNLFIVGTVNMDETTYSFSPKVLDRANVLEFEPVPISSYSDRDDAEYRPMGDVNYLQDCMAGVEVRGLGVREIISRMSSTGSNRACIDAMIADLDELQRMTSNISQSFGFRTVDEIMRFMYVSWVYTGEGEFAQWRRFFDAQIKQKILPKIHGNLGIRDDLTGMMKLCRERGYTESEKKLSKMIGILEKQRHVSFNS